MQGFVNIIVHRLLNILGLKTINSQFLFSYLLIFVLALVSTITLYFSLESSADAINTAGRQRMLSQRLIKEALLVGQNVADQGYVIVQKSYPNVNELLGQIDNTASVLKVLEKDSQEVSQVLSVITSIAEQTNLLALNAAIEAARAGEQGRGFAVVADEVRTLAQRTQESTGEIRRIIESLQTQSDKAVKAMATSQVKVNETVAENSQATEILKAISQSVTQVNEQMSYIAKSSEEQSVSAKDIDSATHSISDVAQQTSSSVQALLQASDDIDVQMANLETMIHKFKHR